MRGPVAIDVLGEGGTGKSASVANTVERGDYSASIEQRRLHSFVLESGQDDTGDFDHSNGLPWLFGSDGIETIKVLAGNDREKRKSMDDSRICAATHRPKHLPLQTCFEARERGTSKNISNVPRAKMVFGAKSGGDCVGKSFDTTQVGTESSGTVANRTRPSVESIEGRAGRGHSKSAARWASVVGVSFGGSFERKIRRCHGSD